jgi:hypothetical protein
VQACWGVLSPCSPYVQASPHSDAGAREHPAASVLLLMLKRTSTMMTTEITSCRMCNGKAGRQAGSAAAHIKLSAKCHKIYSGAGTAGTQCLRQRLLGASLAWAWAWAMCML